MRDDERIGDGGRVDRHQADDPHLDAADLEQRRRPRPFRALPRPLVEHVRGENRVARLLHALEQDGQAEVELVVPQRRGGDADLVERVDHRPPLELVRQQRSLELVAAVDEQRLAGATSRVLADRAHPARQPIRSADRFVRVRSEEARSGRRKQSAVHVVDADDDQPLQPRRLAVRLALLGRSRAGPAADDEQCDGDGAEAVGHPRRLSPIPSDRCTGRLPEKCRLMTHS